MNEPIKIESVEFAVQVGKAYGHHWFRGHPNIYKSLLPKIFRDDFNSEWHQRVATETEFAIIEEFKRIAPSLANNLPGEKEYLDWLILMQHHGCPTRLLDWSESILVALFFAVNSDYEKDGELWVIYPQDLNMKSGLSGFPIPSSNILHYISSAPYHKNPEIIAEKLELKSIPKLPLAFFPTLRFSRMTNQLSAFTIHPNCNDENQIQNLLSPKNSEINRYIIPSEKKKDILMELDMVGIKYRTLFQNLDYLAKDIYQKYTKPFWNVWGKPRLQAHD